MPKIIDIYRRDTVLPLILLLLVFEMLKIPRAIVEAHFLEKLAFVTNKCLAQDGFGKSPRKTEIFQNSDILCTQIIYLNVLII